MKRSAHRESRAFLFVAVFTAMCSSARIAAAEALEFRGQVEQAVSVETPLSGALAFDGSAVSTLAFTLDARRDSASIRASLRLSAVYGSAGSETSSYILALDDLALRWDLASFAFEAGKTYANWGLGKAFSPADFFAEFDYSSGKPSRRSKFLGRATWFPGRTTRVDLVVDPYAALGPTLAARAYGTAFDSLAYSLAAGIRDQSASTALHFLGAAEVTFDLPFITPYLEAALNMAADDPAATAFSLLGGVMARAGRLSLLGEYLYDPKASGGHSMFAQASLPVDEWVSVSAPFLYYPEQDSLSAGISLAADDLAGLDLSATAMATKGISRTWTAKLTGSARFSF